MPQREWTAKHVMVAVDVAAGQLSDAQIAKKHDIKSRNTLLNWRKWKMFADYVAELKAAFKAETTDVTITDQAERMRLKAEREGMYETLAIAVGTKAKLSVVGIEDIAELQPFVDMFQQLSKGADEILDTVARELGQVAATKVRHSGDVSSPVAISVTETRKYDFSELARMDPAELARMHSEALAQPREAQPGS
jgi:transposase-like protein